MEAPPTKQERIRRAIEHVESGLSYREAASLQELNASNLYKHHTGQIKSTVKGKLQNLSADTESLLAECLMYMTDVGFGLDKNVIIGFVLFVVHGILKFVTYVN